MSEFIKKLFDYYYANDFESSILIINWVEWDMDKVRAKEVQEALKEINILQFCFTDAYRLDGMKKIAGTYDWSSFTCLTWNIVLSDIENLVFVPRAI